MITVRKSSERGNSKIGWLNSFHTFSFAEYYDPRFMGFGNLRVINEDVVQPGYGFGKHAHHDMEILSYVVEGVLEHRDSTGTGSVIKAGDIQRMSAGTGVEHSEFNHSKFDLLHFLQIWIIPERKGIKPSYEQKRILQEHDKLILIGSPDGDRHAVKIHQDVHLFTCFMTCKKPIKYSFSKNRNGWLQLIKGKIKLNGHEMSSGDGASITSESEIELTCELSSEFLLFDLG